MVCVAEERLAVPGGEAGRKIFILANEHDHLRNEILVRRGYVRDAWVEFQRRRPLSMPIPEAPVAQGYTIRSLGDASELPARSLVSWKTFHPDEPIEKHGDWSWYYNVQRAPFYRRDLDLVAVAPDGEFAAFCTVWFDDVNRTGAFEPVGTAPAHQRRGLGKSLMCAGLRQLQRSGARMAYVGSYSEGAHALYASAGFTEYERSIPWWKSNFRKWDADRRG
jgi:mycothiol synthase